MKIKKVAILQSNYIPWRGYFDLISLVDEFVIFDEMQYTKRDWRNRNRIKTKDGVLWLTVPVEVKGKYFQNIRETKINGESWRNKHWKTLEFNYIKSKYFKDLADEIEHIYLEENITSLSKLNRRFIDLICSYLGIKTCIRDSFEFSLANNKNERLVNICKELEASEYVSGPKAASYIDKKIFESNNIKLSFADYSGYSEYNQLWGGFEKNLSILDLIFNCGKSSFKYMKYVN